LYLPEGEYVDLLRWLSEHFRCLSYDLFVSVSLELVGVHEVAEMLGITKGAVGARRRGRSFPAPLAELRCGPIWGRWQIEEYVVKRDVKRERRWHIDQVDEIMGR
jgi:hypothetical protein